MPWNPTTKMMTMPISLDDIAAAVGYSGPDLVGNGIINKWAKFKFVRNGALDYSAQMNNVPLLATEWLQNSNWWKGSDGQCGLSFETFNSIGSPSTSGTLFYRLIHELLEWSYNKPRGPQYGEWQRVFDMFRYFGGAQAPVEQPAATTIMLNSSNQLVLDIPVNRGNAYSLSFDDFSINNQSLSNFYFGLLVYLADNQYTFKADHLVYSGDIATTLSNMLPYAGRYVKVAPFLSSVAIQQGIDAGSGVYLSAGVQAFDVLVRPYSTGISATVMPIWADALHGRVRYVLNLINVTAASITANNVVLSLYRSDIQAPIATDSRGSVTVPTGDTPIELSGILIPTVPYDATKTYTVVVTSDNNVISCSAPVDEYRQ